MQLCCRLSSKQLRPRRSRSPWCWFDTVTSKNIANARRRDGDTAIRKRESSRLTVHHVNAERGEEAQDAQRLARPRHVVIASDDDDDRVGQLDRKSTRLNSSH